MRSPFAALAAILLIALPALFAQNPATRLKAPARGRSAAQRMEAIRPTIPTADRHQPGKVFLEFANRLEKQADSPVQILVGNVQFRKGNMFMYCDSARFDETTSTLNAFNNVRMVQGDTLFVYGDELYYDGVRELAELRAYYGHKVKLINRDVSLTTDVFFYDMAQGVGYYETGGTLRDKQNTLRSLQGYYYPSSKDAYFFFNVELTGPRRGDTLRMFTDSLTYNTATNIARLIAPTRIINKDGEINSSRGSYDTRTGLADLLSRSTVHTRRGNTLTGDTLIYDRSKGYGEAFGNMVLTDSARQSAIRGNYGFYNENTDSAFVTGRALALEYSKGDTLYVHADTIVAYMEPDSMRVSNFYRGVRFYRSDVQGLCDSLSIVERDSILYMYYHPVMWYGNKQLAGNVAYLHVNDSTADWARLPEAGIMAEHIAEDCYNQLSGSDITVWMADTTVSRMYIEGNVQVIMFPMEQDSTYNKFNFTESSYLDARFTDGDIDTLRMWPQTSGKVTPLYLAKKSSYFLPKFRWYEPLRPQGPEDVFIQPEEMSELKGNPLGKMRPDATTVRGTPTGRPAPKQPEAAPVTTDETEATEPTEPTEIPNQPENE